MGMYINHYKGQALPAIGKARVLIENGATVTDGKTFTENLVCVVDNVFFEAAGYCFNEREYKDWTNPNDTRPKKWLIVPDAEKYAL